MAISTDEERRSSSWIRRPDSSSSSADDASDEKIRKTMTKENSSTSSSLLRIRRLASLSLLVLLLLLLLPDPTMANFHKSEHDEQFSISGMAQAVWRKFVSPPEEETNDNTIDMPSPPTPQPIKVIGAGLGRTGTSSFVRALELLGLKSYHFQDGMVDTPGHVEMFQKHAKQVVNGEKGIAETIIQGISTAGFNATADYPTCLLYRELMDAYPDALVVLTVRGRPSSSSGGREGLSWAKSMETVLKVSHVQARRIPWRLLPTMKKLFDVASWYLPDVQWDPSTKLPNRDEMAKAYEDHVTEVINTVPSERLLVFAPTDGWKPLCDFLSPLDTIIETNCQTLLTEGTPYPFVNDKEDVERIEQFFWLIATICESLVLIIVLFCQWKLFRLFFGTQYGSKTTKRPKQE